MGITSFITLENKSIPIDCPKPLYLLTPNGNIPVKMLGGYGALEGIGCIYRYTAFANFTQEELAHLSDEQISDIGMSCINFARAVQQSGKKEVDVIQSDEGCMIFNEYLVTDSDLWLLERAGYSFANVEKVSVEEWETLIEGGANRIQMKVCEVLPILSDNPNAQFIKEYVSPTCPYQGFLYPQEMLDGESDSNGVSILV